MSVLGSWSPAAALPADVDHPEFQEVFGYKLEACCTLIGGAVSRAEFAPFPSCPPPASSRGWAGPPLARSSLGWLSSFFVLRTAHSVFRLVNFLSLSCYSTV